MYTLLELQSKTFGELKKIGYELNVLPEDDRRLRKTWIDAITGVNPPLLQLLEVSAASVNQVQEPIIETVETSPGVEVEPVQEAPLESKFGRIVYPRPAQKAISQVAKTSPSVEVDGVSEATSQVAKTSPAASAEKAQEQYPRNARRDCPRCVGIQSLYWTRNFCIEEWVIRCLYCDYERPNNPRFAHLAPPVYGPEEYPAYKEAIRQASAFQAPPPSYLTPGDCCCTWAPLAVHPTEPPPVKNEPKMSQSAIVPAAKTSPGVEVDRVQGALKPDITEFNNRFRATSAGFYRLPRTYATESVDGVEELLPKCAECFDDGFFEEESGFIKFCHCRSDPKLSCQSVQGAIASAVKTSPGSRSKNSTAHQLLELFKSSADIIKDSSGVKVKTAASESAIELATKNLLDEEFEAAKNHIEVESDRTPILTGIALSDRFVARYSPPQAEIVHFHLDANGQLSLLDFEVESVNEPPDPDDFETLDAFREAIARWDREHPSSSVHSEPNSVQKEPPAPEDFDSMFAFWAAYDDWVADDDISSQDKPLEVSFDSFCEWAPCPDEWYEPAALLDQSKVSELSPTCKSSITSDFFIPTFGCWGDRTNRDEPPDTRGIFARLPKPKPPTFPPQASQPKSAQVRLSRSGIPRLSRDYPETIPKPFHRVAAGSSTQPARSPPGGDAV